MSLSIPASAFAQPQPSDVSANPDYWSGYLKGQMFADATVPSAAGVPDYWTYRTAVNAVLLPTVVAGWVNSVNVGYNSAISDGAAWEWVNDPKSGHNVVI